MKNYMPFLLITSVLFCAQCCQAAQDPLMLDQIHKSRALRAAAEAARQQAAQPAHSAATPSQ